MCDSNGVSLFQLSSVLKIIARSSKMRKQKYQYLYLNPFYANYTFFLKNMINKRNTHTKNL